MPSGSARPVFRHSWRKSPIRPDMLWFRGDLSICEKTVVAIVGARAASREGMAAAEAIAGDLARAGMVVASGLARGIDAAAHAGALDAGGTTIAVLGTGIDCVYPEENAALFDRIARGWIAGHRVSSWHPAVSGELSPGAIASSAACLGPCWWSRRPRRAARSSPRAWRPTRAATSWPCRTDGRRPQSRRACLVEGRGKARGVCGRYPARAGHRPCRRRCRAKPRKPLNSR